MLYGSAFAVKLKSGAYCNIYTHMLQRKRKIISNGRNSGLNEAEVLGVCCGFMDLFKDADIKESNGSLFMTHWQRAAAALMQGNRRALLTLGRDKLFHPDCFFKCVWSNQYIHLLRT